MHLTLHKQVFCQFYISSLLTHMGSYTTFCEGHMVSGVFAALVGLLHWSAYVVYFAALVGLLHWSAYVSICAHGATIYILYLGHMVQFCRREADQFVCQQLDIRDISK